MSKETKKKVLGEFHKTSLLFECTFGVLGVQSKDGIMSPKCTRVINLFCSSTNIVLFSFFPWIEDISPRTLPVYLKVKCLRFQ
jgi:hypothetical protein